MSSWWKQHQVDVPEGEVGTAKVEYFTVTEDEARFANMRASFQPGGRREHIEPGRYTALRIDGVLIMSDTPGEIQHDHGGVIRRAQGRVLVHGLGLGMVVGAVLKKPEVEHVTVVEINPDVIALVGPHLQERFGDRLTVIEGDAFTWKPRPGERWDVVWHDVWNELCGDNKEEMTLLHRRFGRRAGWQDSWGKSWLKAMGVI